MGTNKHYISCLIFAEDLTVTSTVTPKSGPKQESKTSNENLHIYIASAAIVIAVVCISIALLVVCRKWKKKKNVDKRGNTHYYHKSTVCNLKYDFFP